MEFEDLQVIWNQQDSQPTFKIDADSLIARFQNEARAMISESNWTELLFALFSGFAVFGYWTNRNQGEPSLFAILSGAYFLIAGLWFLFHYFKRKGQALDLSRSIKDILESAISRYHLSVKVSWRGILFMIVPHMALSAYHQHVTPGLSLGDLLFPDLAGLALCAIAMLLVIRSRAKRIHKLDTFRTQLEQD